MYTLAPGVSTTPSQKISWESCSSIDGVGAVFIDCIDHGQNILRRYAVLDIMDLGEDKSAVWSE